MSEKTPRSTDPMPQGPKLVIGLSASGTDIIVEFPNGRQVFLFAGPLAGTLLVRMLQSRMAEPGARIAESVGTITQAQLEELEMELAGRFTVEPKNLVGKKKRMRDILMATGVRVKPLPKVRRFDVKGRPEGLTLEALGLGKEEES